MYRATQQDRQNDADFSCRLHDLNQDVGDTLKQASGQAPMPSPMDKTPLSEGQVKREMKKADKAEKKAEKAEIKADKAEMKAEKAELKAEKAWADVEAPVAYGYAARSQYKISHPQWDDSLDTELSTEWNKGKAGMSWDEAKVYVRRGFDSVL